MENPADWLRRTCDRLVAAPCDSSKIGSFVCQKPTSILDCAAQGENLHYPQTEPEQVRLQLLAKLPREVLSKLLAGERTLKLREGETLFERGDAGDGCYWLRQACSRSASPRPRASSAFSPSWGRVRSWASSR